MKILIVGGGPGGLYTAILLKKAHPDWDIAIYERNPDGATYGWGVVFSDRTISTFREADFPTYERISDEFVHWTAIDTYYRGEVIRADGHDFAGMSRKRLLIILQERCRELGIPIEFEHEIVLDMGAAAELDLSGFDSITYLNPADYDLVVAADGVNSRIRTMLAPHFKPSLTKGQAKFVWFGTDKVMDAFTFIFQENEHGLFQVHAYPFDGTMSTFIVETAEEVWRRAGLDQATEEESLAYCEALFADYLGGACLLSNRSLWGNFLRVRNRSWRHQNIVLLGDAAHTAHFSIGSGTKLAMDGAIALAQAFESADDLETALNLYELDRRPRVDILQQAAQVSRIYFENTSRYTHLEPQQFTFQLLTRSGRIHYDNLRTRDPYYVDRIDRWFGNQDVGGPLAPPPMFSAFRLRGMDLHNRAAVTLADQAEQTGAALLISAPTAVLPEGRITPDDPTLTDEADIEQWAQTAEQVHTAGGKLALVLNHAGRRGAVQPRAAGLDRPLLDGGWELTAPSALPYHARSSVPRAMEAADFERITAAFVRAAQLADEAGIDMLHLHMAHGYLLASFLSPLSNHRTDEFGGDLPNRMRWPLGVFAAVRAAWPQDKPLGVLLNMDDCQNNGLTAEEAVAVGQALKERGCDIIEPLVGQTTPRGYPAFGPGFLTPYADILRHDVDIPVMVGGFLRTSGEVNTLVAAGRADLCRMEL
ncbi:MAG: hypothetical protein GYB64_01350 [Chloroflexi bacterium]|nr:hypothetical protein [Chloroflexota bacterium]